MTAAATKLETRERMLSSVQVSLVWFVGLLKKVVPVYVKPAKRCSFRSKVRFCSSCETARNTADASSGDYSRIKKLSRPVKKTKLRHLRGYRSIRRD
jgi:hypothetical protein